jgi:hypothetical protein
MSRLLDFYRGHGVDAEGRTIARVWGFSDAELEAVHDFIQWLFPLRDRSRFNPDAPLLTDEDVAAFRSDPALREGLRRSFGVFLGFLGLGLEGGRVVEAPDYPSKRDVFRHPNHNWLRITRVLASTRTLGLEEESSAFFGFLEHLRDSGRSGITADTFDYWRDAAGRGRSL